MGTVDSNHQPIDSNQPVNGPDIKNLNLGTAKVTSSWRGRSVTVESRDGTEHKFSFSEFMGLLKNDRAEKNAYINEIKADSPKETSRKKEAITNSKIIMNITKDFEKDSRNPLISLLGYLGMKGYANRTAEMKEMEKAIPLLPQNYTDKMQEIKDKIKDKNAQILKQKDKLKEEPGKVTTQKAEQLTVEINELNKKFNGVKKEFETNWPADYKKLAGADILNEAKAIPLANVSTKEEILKDKIDKLKKEISSVERNYEESNDIVSGGKVSYTKNELREAALGKPSVDLARAEGELKNMAPTPKTAKGYEDEIKQVKKELEESQAQLKAVEREEHAHHEPIVLKINIESNETRLKTLEEGMARDFKPKTAKVYEDEIKQIKTELEREQNHIRSFDDKPIFQSSLKILKEQVEVKKEKLKALEEGMAKEFKTEYDAMSVSKKVEVGETLKTAKAYEDEIKQIKAELQKDQNQIQYSEGEGVPQYALKILREQLEVKKEKLKTLEEGMAKEFKTEYDAMSVSKKVEVGETLKTAKAYEDEIKELKAILVRSRNTLTRANDKGIVDPKLQQVAERIKMGEKRLETLEKEMARDFKTEFDAMSVSKKVGAPTTAKDYENKIKQIKTELERYRNGMRRFKQEGIVNHTVELVAKGIELREERLETLEKEMARDFKAEYDAMQKQS